MTPATLLQGLPRRVRNGIYATFVVVGLLVGATQIAFAGIPGGTEPAWLDVVINVYAYLGVALGITAKANVPSEEALVIEPDDNYDDYEPQHRADDV